MNENWEFFKKRQLNDSIIKKKDKTDSVKWK